MGLLDKLGKQLLDIIEWPDTTSNVLVHRFDRQDHEIKWHAKLVVRPGQKAVFVNEGQIADAFEPGTYTLDTKNLPILRTLLSWPYGFESPYKAEVYFIKTTEQLDRKWGTPNPVMLRDTDFGIVRLRMRGNYSYKIGISSGMISRFVGAQAEFTTDDIEGQVRTKVISSVSDCVAELKIPALDLATKYDEIGDAMQEKLKKSFEGLGLELLRFVIENVSLPEDVQKAMDQRASLGALGDLNKYSQYQAANALRDAAQNEGGMGNMMGMMMGSQLGGQMGGGIANTLQQPQGQQQATPPPSAPPPLPPNGPKFFAAIGGQQAGPFSISELQQQIQTGQINKDTLIWKDGMANWTKAGEVQGVSSFFGSAPPPLPPQ